MSTNARVVLAVVAAALAVAPTAALAQRMGGGARVGSGGASHRGFHHGSPGGRSFVHRPFGGIVVFAPPFWYGPDISYDPGSGYGPAPAYGAALYGPAMSGPLALGPSSPPMPTVVQYPTGRWELRGDGLTIPYRWVWIPNPPAAPPSSTPPGGDPLAPGPPASSPASSRIYRWTDGQGVLHLTDRLDTIPERYRAQARASRPS